MRSILCKILGHKWRKYGIAHDHNTWIEGWSPGPWTLSKPPIAWCNRCKRCNTARQPDWIVVPSLSTEDRQLVKEFFSRMRITNIDTGLPMRCETCFGSGDGGYTTRRWTTRVGEYVYGSVVPCPDCNGTGERDAPVGENTGETPKWLREATTLREFGKGGWQ